MFRAMCQIWLRRIRRRRMGMVVLSITGVVFYCLTSNNIRRSADLSVKTVLRSPPPPQLSSVATRKHPDIFATHFQKGFRFHTNKSSRLNEKTPNRTLRLGMNLWEEFFQPRPQQQFSLGKYTYLHQANRTCLQPVDILMMIVSSPQNHLQRQAIRDTWGSVVRTQTWPMHNATQRLTERVGLVFLLGEEQPPTRQTSEAVQLEVETYGDVVQWAGLHDTYFNLTMKVLLGLKWAVQFCPPMSLVAKADDDTFVHVPRLLKRVSGSHWKNTIWGPYFSSSPCKRIGKYAVSQQAYPFDSFPPHVKGNLYVLSADLVPRLALVAPYLPYNNMEDVHVTGTLARALDVSHQALTRREMSVVPKCPPLCVFEDGLVTLASQSVSPVLALSIWDTFSKWQLCHGDKSGGDR